MIWSIGMNYIFGFAKSWLWLLDLVVPGYGGLNYNHFWTSAQGCIMLTSHYVSMMSVVCILCITVEGVRQIEVLGRTLRFEKTCGPILDVGFAELCNKVYTHIQVSYELYMLNGHV